MILVQNPFSGYKIIISLIFGLVSFLLNIYGIDFQIANHSIVLYPGLAFPVMIAIVWGWKYGLLAVFAGGYFPVFFNWESEGYGTLFLFLSYLLWVVWHGIWKDIRNKSGDNIWNNVITLELLYRFFMIISYLTLYPLLISQNPPFWNKTIYLNSHPAIYLINYIVLYTFVCFFVILLFKLSLSNKTIRLLFKLDPLPWQKKIQHVLYLVIGLGIVLWFLLGLFRYYIVYFSSIPIKQILFYRGFNNYFIQDIIIISLITLFFIVYEHQIKTAWEAQKTILNKGFYDFSELKTNHAILIECSNTINSLLLSSTIDEQISVLCRALPHIPNLRNHWIIRFPAQSSRPVFLSETSQKTRQNIMAYVNSHEGKNRIKKLIKTFEPAVDPAVIVNEKDLFPDIYHVLISACYTINSDCLYIGLVVEENLSRTELFKSFLSSVTAALHPPVKLERFNDLSDIATQKREKTVFFQSFYSGIPGYWIITNPSFSIKIISQDFSSFSGYSASEITGADLRTFLIREDKPNIPTEADRLTEGFIIQKNGSRVPVQYICSSLTKMDSPVLLFHIADNLTGYMGLKALNDREFRYRSYFNNMSDASFVIDRTTRIIDVNQTACTLFKYNRNELVGLRIEDIISEEDKPNIELYMQSILQKNTARFEGTPLTKFGHRILTEVHAKRFNEYGHDLIHVVLRNISERKKQERDLIDFQNTIKSFAKQGQSVFVGFTEQEQICFVNQAAVELSGCSENELKNAVFHEIFVSPESQKKAALIFQQLLTNKPNNSRHLLPVIGPDGTEHILLWDFTHITREMQFNLFWGTGTDVTLLYKDLERTRHEKEKFETYLNRFPLSVFIFSETEFIQNTNTSAEALLGYQYHEFKLLSLKDIMPDTDYEKIKSKIDKTATWEAFTDSVNLIDSGKNIISVMVNITVLQDRDIMMFVVE